MLGIWVSQMRGQEGCVCKMPQTNMKLSNKNISFRKGETLIPQFSTIIFFIVLNYVYVSICGYVHESAGAQ